MGYAGQRNTSLWVHRATQYLDRLRRATQYFDRLQRATQATQGNIILSIDDPPFEIYYSDACYSSDYVILEIIIIIIVN